ncbi:MAG: ABC transporter permease subunit [Akkermansiaceae bacterium]|nr:ABC transporter permease subunit [Akkermansiaceae bacterium]
MKARLFQTGCYLSVGLLLVAMGYLIGLITYKGVPTLGAPLFFGDTPAWQALLGRQPVWDGIWPACVGTLMVVMLALALAFLPGVATGIWLSEYHHSRLARVLGLAVDVLAGIPSILMGLFGFSLILFFRQYISPAANACLLLSASCLAMLILPYLAGTTRTALQAVPFSLRLTAQALGMSPWQSLRHILLPKAVKGIGRGVMLSVGRAAEDTAVIMLTGVVANAGLPSGLFERYEALPFAIFYYSAQYQTPDELAMAFGAALTLMFFTAASFSIAGIITNNKRFNLGS